MMLLLLLLLFLPLLHVLHECTELGGVEEVIGYDQLHVGLRGQGRLEGLHSVHSNGLVAEKKYLLLTDWKNVISTVLPVRFPRMGKIGQMRKHYYRFCFSAQKQTGTLLFLCYRIFTIQLDDALALT